MTVTIESYKASDVDEMKKIWNDVVEEGRAFPQESVMDSAEAETFFASQSYTGVARVDGRIGGLYILHPNNIGRCGHICNCSYAVAKELRGHGTGEELVRHSLAKARDLGFGIMQFNAVAISNKSAHKLYERLGFVPLGIVPGGFRRKDGTFEDIRLYYHQL